MDIPKPKKSIGAFIAQEEGRISKQSLLKTGAVLTTLSLGVGLSAEDAEAGTWGMMCMILSFILRSIEIHRNMLHFNPIGEDEAAASHDNCITRFV